MFFGGDKEKKERCPKGSIRNKKTGDCDKKKEIPKERIIHEETKENRREERREEEKRNEENRQEEEEEKEKEDQQIKETSYENALQKYFALKSNYENKIRVLAKENMDKTKSTAKRPRCINCGTYGGTIFAQKNRKYTAVCNASPPCGLHIDIYRGYFTNIENTVYELRDIIETSKECIISLKNDEIYKYKSPIDCIREFKYEGSHYETAERMYQDLTHKMTNLHDNIEKKEKIDELRQKIHDTIVELYSLEQDYRKTDINQGDIVKTMVEKQTQELFPIMAKLHELQWEVNQVDVGESLHTVEYKKNGIMVSEKRGVIMSNLIQQKVSPYKDDLNIREEPRVNVWDT